jgi:hypothetical protein
LQSTFQHVQHATSLAALNDAVSRDFLRAAQLAEPSLTAFDKIRDTAESGGAATLAGPPKSVDPSIQAS